MADVPERCMPVISSGGTPTAAIVMAEPRATMRRVTSAGAADQADVEFALIVEAGPLEAQALLLVESLRAFGGRHASASVTAVSPRPERRPARGTVRALRRLGAEYVTLDVAGACPAYPTSWRVHALAVLERRPGPAVLVQLDSDAVVPRRRRAAVRRRAGERPPGRREGHGEHRARRRVRALLGVALPPRRRRRRRAPVRPQHGGRRAGPRDPQRRVRGGAPRVRAVRPCRRLSSAAASPPISGRTRARGSTSSPASARWASRGASGGARRSRSCRSPRRASASSSGRCRRRSTCRCTPGPRSSRSRPSCCTPTITGCWPTRCRIPTRCSTPVRSAPTPPSRGCDRACRFERRRDARGALEGRPLRAEMPAP